MAKRSRLRLSKRARLAVVGALALLALVLLRRQTPAPAAPSPPPVLVGTPKPSPSPQAVPAPLPASPTGEPAAAGVVASLGVVFSLPDGYRVATELNAYEASADRQARFTLTRGSPAQEAEYVVLLRELQALQTATEAPAFLPGQTITLQEATTFASEESEAALARSKEAVATAAGLSGTRYRRVEGVQVYDATYLSLSDGRRVAIHMAYSTEEPLFDEAAYGHVLNTFREKER